MTHTYQDICIPNDEGQLGFIVGNLNNALLNSWQCFKIASVIYPSVYVVTLGDTADSLFVATRFFVGCMVTNVVKYNCDIEHVNGLGKFARQTLASGVGGAVGYYSKSSNPLIGMYNGISYEILYNSEHPLKWWIGGPLIETGEAILRKENVKEVELSALGGVLTTFVYKIYDSIGIFELGDDTFANLSGKLVKNLSSTSDYSLEEL